MNSQDQTKPKVDSKNALEVTKFNEIERLYSKKLYKTASTRISSFVTRFPQSTYIPAVENYHGLILLQSKEPAEAAIHFKKAIHANPTSNDFNQYVLYNLATAQLEAKEINPAQETAQQISLSSLDKPNQIKLHYLRATLYEKQSHPLEAARQLLAASKLGGAMGSSEANSALYKRMDHNLLEILNSPNATNDLSALAELYKEYEDAPVSDSVLFHLGAKELSSGNSENAKTHLKALIARFPQSPYFLQATEFLSKPTPPSPTSTSSPSPTPTSFPKDNIPIETKSIGILLPTQGKLARYGTSSLQAIQLVLQEPYHLVIQDSGETIEQGVAALDKLVREHHVAAVIGPLVTKGVDQISAHAQMLGVPLISLARRAGPPQEFVFQAGLTQEIQAYEIARYAIETLHARNFAIIYPNEKLGIEASNSFWEAVESMGGKIVGVESYSSGETDFRQTIDRLSGLYYTEARQRELDLLAQEREANHIKKRTRKNEQFFHLRPIVDYDAVFIPDEPTIAGQILPTFAYRDVDHVKFLGTSSWNSPDFISRAQSYGEHASFVDAFFPDNASKQARSFIESFKAAYHQDPTSLEALAYDAGLLLKQAMTSLPTHFSRTELKDRLKMTLDFQGVTGKISFKNGQFYRNLTVLKIKRGAFVRASTN